MNSGLGMGTIVGHIGVNLFQLFWNLYRMHFTSINMSHR